jgi:HAD superfamily hydrolase (TIGR01490 family)
MSLAIFDLDETLLSGDSDHEWGIFIVEKGLADKESYLRENDRFYGEYKAGTLDIYAWIRFVLRPLIGMSRAELAKLHAEFMKLKIEAIILPKGLALLAEHRNRGDELLMISATNEVITAPIAQRLGVPNLIASGVQFVGDCVNGEPEGEPSFREGKVLRLKEWMKGKGLNLKGSSFYSDSRNDIPLLELVENPVAVDPDDALRQLAQERGWKIISLR